MTQKHDNLFNTLAAFEFCGTMCTTGALQAVATSLIFGNLSRRILDDNKQALSVCTSMW